MNKDADILICNKNLRLPNSYKDIFYSHPANRDLKTGDMQKLAFFVGRKSFANDFKNLKENLFTLRDTKIFYLALLQRDKHGICPLDIAIEQNSAKTLETMINALI